jgi:transposase-like protein
MKKKQIDFIEMYKLKAGNISEVCKAFGIARETFYDWRKTFPDFDKAIYDADNAKKDWVESKIIQRINEGSDKVLLFYAKHQLQDRGYIDKHEIQHSGDVGLIIDDINKAYKDED